MKIRLPFTTRKPVRAFDVSNFWLNTPVTDLGASQLMTKARVLGYAGVMLGTYDASIAMQQSKAAKFAGLWRDSFVYLYMDGNDRSRIERAATVPVSGLCWIDCEDEGEGVSGLAIPEVIDHIIAAVNTAWSFGLKPAIYTRPLWWKTYTGDTHDFAAYPLWVADPDGVAVNDAAYWKRIAFGGFARPAWKQYAFDQNVAGMNADVSIGQS